MIPDIVHFWLWTILMDELETAQIQYPINNIICIYNIYWFYSSSSIYYLFTLLIMEIIFSIKCVRASGIGGIH